MRKQQGLLSEEMMFLARGLYLGTVWATEIHEQLDPATTLLLRRVAITEPELLKLLDETIVFGSQEITVVDGVRIPRVLHFVSADDARVIYQAAGAAVNLRSSRSGMPFEVVKNLTEEFVDEMIVQIVYDEHRERARQSEMVVG